MGNAVKKVTKDDIKKLYSIKEKLGEGNFAVVHRCVRKKDREEFAVKIIKKTSLDTAELALLHDEQTIMYRVDHPHCVKLMEIFETKKKLYMVIELLTGGELFERIVKSGNYAEQDAARVMHQCASALEYLHNIGVVHRDLKPENLIYATPAPDSPLKITDFGLAKYHKPSTEAMLFTTQCGTPGYVAPEVLVGKAAYTEAVDMWSLGVILYILLCGYPPFYAENNRALYRQIRRGQYTFQEEYWGDVSEGAKDLVRRLLTVDPKHRLTAAGVLQHPWVKNAETASTRDLALNQRLNRTLVRQKLRRGVQMILAVNKFRGLFRNMRTQQYPAGSVDVAGAAAGAGLRVTNAGPEAGTTSPPSATRST